MICISLNYFSQPQFAALSNLNSTVLPANFVLKLAKPIPMATNLVRDIQNITNASKLQFIWKYFYRCMMNMT